MKEVFLHDTRGKMPNIYDNEIFCPTCGNFHEMGDDVRPKGINFIGISTAGMQENEALEKGADLKVKSRDAIEYFKH